MIALRRRLARFAADESGATAIEYSVVAAGIAGAIVTALGTTGTKVGELWTTIIDALG